LRRPYNTDRPSKTDSPFTIDAGVFQIESDVANWTLDYEKGVRVRTWIIGNANFKLDLTNWMGSPGFPAILCQHAHERAWFWETARTRRLWRYYGAVKNQSSWKRRRQVGNRIPLVIKNTDETRVIPETMFGNPVLVYL